MLFIVILFIVMFFKPKYFILLFVLHILYCVGISANELQHEAFNAFDRIPLEYKMNSPKFNHILELVQNQKPELTSEQQFEYANSLARSEFAADNRYSVLGALAIATDVVTGAGGVSTVMFFLFVLIGAVKNYKQKRAEKKNADNTVSDAKVEQTSDKQQDI